MNLVTYLSSISPPDALALVGAVALKGALLFLFALLVARMMRRNSASARHAVWALALAGALLLPVFFATLPGWQVPVLPNASGDAFVVAPLAPGAPQALLPPRAPRAPLAPRVQAPHAPHAHVTPEPEVHIHIREQSGITVIERHAEETILPLPSTAPAFQETQSVVLTLLPPALRSWQMWIVVAWLAGVGFFLFRWLAAVVGAWWLVRDAEPVTDPEWLELQERIAYGFDLDIEVRLLRSDRLGVPVAGGILDPVVLLPADADEWSEERREVVLTHELAHIARRDCLTQTVAQWSVALHWFNPLAWYAHKQYLLEREHACDDYVLNHGTLPSDYAEHLLQIARRFRREPLALSATAPMARRSNLETRITSILNPERRRTVIGRAALAAVSVLALGLVLPLAAFQPVEKPMDMTGVQFAALSSSPVKVFADRLPKGLTQTLRGEETFEWTGQVQADGFVEVRGINGPIQARTGSGNRVQVEARKSSRRGQEGTVDITVEEFSNGVVICAVYPGQRANCAPGEGPEGNTENNDVTVSFDVVLPENVKFVGRTVNGDITTGTLGSDAALHTVNGSIRTASRGGDIEARTVNGSIRAEAGGVVRAGTVNGSIEARLGRADWSGEMAFKTVNGSVTLDLPSAVNTTVEASTQTGRIYSDFPLRIERDRYVGSQAEGTIGSGGRHLELNVLNGSIRLQRASGSFGSRLDRDRRGRDDDRIVREQRRVIERQARAEDRQVRVLERQLRDEQREVERRMTAMQRELEEQARDFEERMRQDGAWMRSFEERAAQDEEWARSMKEEYLDLAEEALANIGPVMELALAEAGRALESVDLGYEIEAALADVDWDEIEHAFDEAEHELEAAMDEVEHELERLADHLEECEDEHDEWR